MRLCLSVLFVAACGNSATNGNPDLATEMRVDLSGADFYGIDLAGSCATPPPLTLTSVVTGLAEPTFVTAEDAHRLFILERAGKIRIAVDGVLKPAAFLDLTAQVSSTGSDDGLLGLALHPQYATNGRFFVHYSDTNSNVVIAEYARSAGNPDSATPTAIQTLLTQNAAAGIRYGGMLTFGPDGFLYAGVGDGAPDGDPNKNAQNLSSPLGKILRYDVDNVAVAPTGNLMGPVWSYGWREPWRFSFDRTTGELYLADTGHPTWQEIMVEPPATSGRNYGWPITTGSHCRSAGCDQSTLTGPDLEYSGCAIIGGYVYRGAAAGCLDGWFVYSDYCKPELHAFKKGGAKADLDVSGTLDAISSFGETADGELLAVDYGAGIIYRLDPR
jgi:glucose/arabinose dehydrogenase